MTHHTIPLEDENKRRRLLQQGDHVTFDMAFFDSGKTSRDAVVTDSAPAVAARFVELIDRARREHAERFAFLGASAPAFDQQAAELVARSTIYSEGARASINAIRDARYAGYAASTAAEPSQSAQGDYSPRQVTDALRAARYA